MARNNPTNPYTRDANHTSKDVQMPIAKARVVSAKGHPDMNGFHTVRIRVYGDDATYVAPVLVPMAGCVWVPESGTDVAVLFTQSDKPWVVGSWYALDRVEDGDVLLPDYNPGDIRLGNPTGSHVTVSQDGSISVSTDDDEPVDIDHQSGTVYLAQDGAIRGDDTYEKIEFDTTDPENDPEGLFDATSHSFTIKDGGQHRVEASVEVPTGGQNSLYTLAIFRNGSEFKRSNRQSAVNEPLTLHVNTQQHLDTGDEIDIRLKQNSGTDKSVSSDTAATEFSITRRGI